MSVMNYFNKESAKKSEETGPDDPGRPKSADSANVLDIFNKGGQHMAKKADLSKGGVNWPEWTAKNVYLILDACYALKESALILGRAGIGKSAIVKHFAKMKAEEEGRKLVVFEELDDEQQIAAIKDPSSYYFVIDKRPDELNNPDMLTGVPDIAKASELGYARFLPPPWVRLIHQRTFSGVVFLDELNRAEGSTLSYLMKLTHPEDRSIGGRKISDGATIVAAGNWAPDGSFGSLALLDSAQIGRFTAGVLVITPQEWELYAKKAGINRYIIQYAMIEPDENLFGKGTDLTNGNLPCNPRALTAVSKAMNLVVSRYEDHYHKSAPLPMGYSGDLIEDLVNVLAGKAGSKWIDNFIYWLKIVRKFDIETILKDAEAGKFRTKAGGKKAEELTGAAKWAFITYVADWVDAEWKKAWKSGEDEPRKAVVDKVTRLLRNIDPDFLMLVLTRIKEAIKDLNPDQTEAAKEWNWFFINSNTGVAGIAQKKYPDFFKELQAALMMMAKQINPQAEEELKKVMADQAAKKGAAPTT